MKNGAVGVLTRWALFGSVAVCSLAIATDAHAIDVASQTDWNTAVAAVAAAGAGSTVSINITSGFTLTSSLAALQASNANVTVNITGNSQTINGASAFQGIVVNGANAPTVTISSLALTNTAALGGTGGNGQAGYYSSGLSYGSGGGGGGGLGAGGGLFVGSGANVTLSAVTFTGNSATGGAGGNGGSAQNTASDPANGGNGGAGGAADDGGAVGGGGAGGVGGHAGGQGTAGAAGSNLGDGGGGGGGSGTTSSTSYTANNNGGSGNAGGGSGRAGGDGVTNNGGSQGPGADGGSGGNGGSAQGGAIYVAPGGTLTIDDTPISGATVTGGAGGSNGTGQGPSSINGAAGSAGTGSGAGIYLSGVAATVGVSSGTQTYASSIAGTGFGGIALTKTGAGTLALTATNSFIGNLVVDAGTVAVAGAANLGAASNGIVLNGANLEVTANATLANTHAISLSGVSGIDIDPGMTVTLQGAITNGASAGTLDKTGNGTLILGANATYTGGTFVDAGTLQLGTGVSLATGALTVNAGTFDLNNNSQTVSSLAGSGGTITLGTGTLTDNQTGTTTYSGAIAGTGGLALGGAGTLILDGINTYTGATTLASGSTLMVGDAASPTASLAGALTANSSATVAGYGTIGSVSNNGGMVVPGGVSGTIGTLHVAGNFTQTSGSTVIEVNPTAAAQLAVTGTAALAGGLKLVYDPGTYTAKTYDIVHAGSVAGTYGTVTATGSSPSLAQSIAYTGTDVDLVLGGASTVVSTNTGVLGDSSSLALDNFFASDDDVFGHLDDMGQGNDSVKNALAGAAPMQISMNGGLQQLAQLGSQLPNALAQSGGWVRGIGAFQSARDQGAAAGYSASGGGFLAGIDHPWGDLTLGVAAGYSGTNTKQNDGSTGDIQTPRVMAYARYQAAPQVVIDGITGFAYDSIHTTRSIAALGTNAVESHSGTEEDLALRAGYLLPWQGLTLIPRIGAQYVHLSQNGYSETGGSGYDLSAPSSHFDSFQPLVSFSALEAFTTASGMRLVPELKVAYSHELLGTSQTLALTTPTGSVVAGTVLTPARNTITVGPELTAQLNQQLSVYGDYEAIIGLGKSLDNVVFAGARWAF